MNSSFTKYALITGASSGIGWHLSIELAQRGYSIIAVSNQPQQLEDLKKELEQKYAVQVFTLNLNLALPDSAKQVFDFCEANSIEVEALVNNAGILIFGEAARVEYAKAATILQLHMNTPALLCRLFGEKMMARKKGFILNVSSISSVMPYPGISLYGPSKTFLRYFTRALRTEMKLYEVNVTCLLPGATATALYDTHNINVPLAMKLGVMKKPEGIAKAGVNALFNNRAECIPGWINKLTVRIIPYVPHVFIGLIHKSARFVKRKG